MRRRLLTSVKFLRFWHRWIGPGYTIMGAGILALVLTSGALASGFSVGSFDRHVAAHHVLACGSPVSGVTWIPRQATQHFQRCIIVGKYRVLTPTAFAQTPTPRSTLLPSPTVIPTAVPIPTAWPTVIPSATPVPSNDPAQQLLMLINDHRASYGSAPLQLISDATTSLHAAYMAGDGTIWHASSLHPDASFPYDGFGGENVGAGQYVQQIDQGMWAEGVTTCNLGTVSHACNIVNPGFHYVAIGLSSGLLFGYPAVYLVEDFRS